MPIVVHEANPCAGMRQPARRDAHHPRVHQPAGHAEAASGEYIGLPIRRQIAELDRLALGDKARAHFGLRTDMPVLLVTGGSQGARSLNRALAGAASAIRAAGVQILHVTGPKNIGEVSAPPGTVPYVAVPYVDRMDLAYAAADFVLCRAGAMTCAELTAVGLPAAYVPLPYGNGEQRLNALPIVRRGGGMLVDDAELTPEWIKSTLLPVLTNIDRVVGMSEAAASARPQERRPGAGLGGHRGRRQRPGQARLAPCPRRPRTSPSNHRRPATSPCQSRKAASSSPRASARRASEPPD